MRTGRALFGVVAATMLAASVVSAQEPLKNFGPPTLSADKTTCVFPLTAGVYKNEGTAELVVVPGAVNGKPVEKDDIIVTFRDVRRQAVWKWLVKGRKVNELGPKPRLDDVIAQKIAIDAMRSDFPGLTVPCFIAQSTGGVPTLQP